LKQKASCNNKDFFTGMGKRELFEMTQKNLVAKKSIPLTRQRRGTSWKNVFFRIKKEKHFPLIKFFFFLPELSFFFLFSYIHQI
jgi:hypothetical protein